MLFKDRRYHNGNMWPSPSFRKKETFVAVKCIMLIVLMLIILAHNCCGEDNLTASDSSSEIDSSRNDSTSESNSSLNDSTSESNSSLNDSAIEESIYDTHVYITNDDNERLKVSLFIDNELKESKELSADSETKIDTYQLSKGPHRFKITWWDEDVKKSFEAEEQKSIEEETSVNLYTILHDALEKFDISVKLTNENENSLEAYLYVDGSFEKSKEVSKDSTADLGTIKLEEGIHNLSVKWQDTETRIEYEKTRKIAVSKEDVVVFYAPKGVSFEAEKSIASSEKSSYSSSYSSTKSATATKESYQTTKTTEKDNDSFANSSEKLPISEATSSKSSITNAETKSFSSRDTEGEKERQNRPISASALDDSDKIYLYAILVIIAVYLILRH